MFSFIILRLLQPKGEHRDAKFSMVLLFFPQNSYLAKLALIVLAAVKYRWLQILFTANELLDPVLSRHQCGILLDDLDHLLLRRS